MRACHTLEVVVRSEDRKQVPRAACENQLPATPAVPVRITALTLVQVVGGGY